MSTAARTREATASAPPSIENARLPAVYGPTRGGWLKQKTVKRALFVAADAFALLLANWAAEFVVQHFLRIPGGELTPRGYMVFYLPFLLGVFYLLERSQSHELRRPEKELELAVKGVSYAFLLLVCANFVVFKTGFSRYLMVCWYVLSLVTVLAARYGIRVFYGRLWERGLARRRTLLVGSAERLFELETLLAIQRYRAYEIIGILPAGSSTPVNGSGQVLRVLGSLEQWREVAEENGVEQVIVALPGAGTEAHDLVSGILRHCLAAGIDVQVYSDMFASREFHYELDEFSGFFRFYATPRWSKNMQLIARSVLDKLAGLVGSGITLLILPVVALLLKIEDGGPLFYKSEFVDCDRKVQYYRKFRTMCADADQVLQTDPTLKAKFEEKYKLLDDPRVLRVGRLLRKYSIDELPQFFSLLSGRLSLVGPRTISRGETPRYGPYLPKLLSVKPGLTGFWQVMGRQLTTYQERVQMDMFYIDHWSIWLDLWIVIKTFWKVLRAEGAY
jgi:exopolysaccharide biosynthesis polyprenyl glycosylphosphotransferase